MTEIHETEFSPAVVQHPFTSSGITVLPRDGVLQLGNICSSESDLAAWREYMKKQIGNATCAYHIYMMTNKPYGLTFLKYTSPFLSKEEFSKILSDAWARSENPNSDPNFTQKELVSMFKQADPTILMDQAERKRLAELEDTVTVYRGVTSLNADNIRAMSWTLDKEVAEWFAHRYKEDGTVYEGGSYVRLVGRSDQWYHRRDFGRICGDRTDDLEHHLVDDDEVDVRNGIRRHC